jgi:hypothetical protein
VAITGGGLLLLLLALGIWYSGGSENAGLWQKLMTVPRDSGESYLQSQLYDDPAFVAQAAGLAAQQLAVAGAILMLLGGVFLRFEITGRIAAGVVLLAVMELFLFARGIRATFDLRRTNLPGMKRFLAAHPGDYRIVTPNYPNAPLLVDAFGLWGYEPSIPLRYAQFIAATQGRSPDDATQYIGFQDDIERYDLLRRRFTFLPGQKGSGYEVRENTNYLPHLLLAGQCRVMTNRDDIFVAMSRPGFNPRREVILERAPAPAPQPGAEAGTVRLVNESTDWLDIEADLKSPGILLITDNYMKGWRARALPGSSQAHYEVLPADWCLRAVPLAAGHHELRVEYVPAGFVAGKYVSIISLAAFCLAAAISLRRWKAKPAPAAGGAPDPSEP